MSLYLYTRLRAEVAELRRRIASTATGGGGTPSAHGSSHEDGGSDELDVTGLTGLLATPQTPATHATSHQNAGGDEINVGGLSGVLADAQTVGVRKNSAGSTFTRPRLNLIEGSNVTLTVADDAVDGEVDITVAAATSAGITELTGDVTAGPGSGSQAATIANDAVTNAKAANMVQATLKGRADGAGTGDPTDLTANQASTILDTATDPFLRTSAAAAGGITTLTGDVTAGPGSGSQAATIPNGTVTPAKSSTALKTRQITVPIPGNGIDDITTGVKEIDLTVPYSGTITAWRIVSRQTGDIVIDVLKSTYAAFPTMASITGGAEPELSGAQKDEDTVSWAVTAGDLIDVEVLSCSGIIRCTLTFTVMLS